MNLLEKTASLSSQKAQDKREIIFSFLGLFVGILYAAIKLFYQHDIVSVFLVFSSVMLFSRYAFGALILIPKIDYNFSFRHQALNTIIFFLLLLTIKYADFPLLWFSITAITYFLAALKHNFVLEEDKNPLVKKKMILDILAGLIFSLFFILLSLKNLFFEISFLVLVSQIFGFMLLARVKKYV